MEQSLFTEITIILALASALAIAFRMAKQPPVLAYILTGVILGPLGLLSLQHGEAFHGFAEIGITLLLFLLGLELRLSELRMVGKIALITGIGQIFFTSAIGYFICILLGFESLTSLYIAIALTFSSTIIIVKLLSDRKELNSLHGKISVGFLLVQDFVAIIALVLLAGLTGSAGTEDVAISALVTIFKAIILFCVVVVASQVFFPKLIHKLAHSSEVLFVFAVAWAFGVSALASSELVGLSPEIGGFLAGLALANATESFQIVTKLRSIRDFFIIIFFVNLGMSLQLAAIAPVLPVAILLSVFVLVGNPIIVLALMGYMGYKKRTGFMAGLTVAQISEFSLIVMFMARRLDHVDDAAISMVTLVGIITFTLSTYAIINANTLYRWLEPYLGVFERKGAKVTGLGAEHKQLNKHIVLVGAHRIGRNILSKLGNSERDVVVVDFDPSVADSLKSDGVNFVFGDIADSEVQDKVELHKAAVVISTAPSMEDNLILMANLRKLNPKAKVIIVSHYEEDSAELISAGADHVIYPYSYVGEAVGSIIAKDSFEKLDKFASESLVV